MGGGVFNVEGPGVGEGDGAGEGDGVGEGDSIDDLGDCASFPSAIGYM